MQAPGNTKKTSALLTLMQLYNDYQENPSVYFSCRLINNDYFKWRCIAPGPKDTEYYGAFLPIELHFPGNFPNDPPQMYIKCPIWHPNIEYDTGKVCMAILHEARDDPHNAYEKFTDKWSPNVTIESIFIILMYILQNPTTNSPFNPFANGDYIKQRDVYNQKVKKCVLNSIECINPSFSSPLNVETLKTPIPT